ncbi:MAG: LAGLIDADG family homing endonuclease [Candidatus ainarchaeum sp.]|nr:LAGLIDADG family homing endonuclease [Candidatus ainarchaeum sp.]
MLSKDYILGFVEGEGCFSIAISKYIDRKPRKTNKKSFIKNPRLFAIRPSFRITNSLSNIGVLEEIKETLGFGSIYIQNRKSDRNQSVAYFYTKSFEDCLKAKDFFKDIEFKTTKGKDFLFWCECLEIIQNKQHLDKIGILKLCEIRDKMNFRLTKNKWSTQEISKILDEKPNHFIHHINQNQTNLLHNNVDLNSNWLEKKMGNSKPSKFVSASSNS